MSEQTKRQQLEMHLTRRALEDPGFRDALLKNPKVAIEKEIGLKFPEALSIAIHEEKLNQLHVVLPVDLVTGDDLPQPLDAGRISARRRAFWRKN
jgi:hypothetical protein